MSNDKSLRPHTQVLTRGFDPSLSVGDAGVDDRQHSGVCDQPRIDSRRRAAEVERREREGGIAPERDAEHSPAIGGGGGGRAADELDDCGRCGHGETAQPVGLGDGRIAEVCGRVL